MEPDAVEIRVLGCLLEKQRTTPAAYPLSLNSLRLACNQATSRDPVVDYDEATIREALTHLGQRRWTRLASAGRSVKYRHLLNETLDLAPDQIAVLCVMMLRGPQTLNELRTRTDRLHDFADTAELEATLAGLMQRELVELLDRRPGQKEQRYRQLLGAVDEPAADDVAPPPRAAGYPTPPSPSVNPTRLEELEHEVAGLRQELRDLHDEVRAIRAELGG